MLRSNPSLERWTRFGRPERQFSHWTIALSERLFGVLVTLFTLFHFFVSAWLPLVDDEIYYDIWARDLSLSYFDHPPMIAVMIRLSTALFGHTAFGIRFLSVVIASIIVLLLSRLTDKRFLLTFSLFTPLFLWGSVLTTPDIPFILFWTLYFLWSVNLSRKFSAWSDDPVQRVYRPSPVSFSDWGIGGALLGLGLLSKYSMILAPICLLLALIRYRFSAWWRGYFVHALIAIILFFPVILFNQRHGFEPFVFQWLHATGLGTESGSIRPFGEFLGSQIVLVGALPVILLFWQLIRVREIVERPLLNVSSIFFTLPFIFVMIQSTQTKVEANWSFMAFVSFWVLAQSILDTTSFRMESTVIVWLSFLPSIATSLLMAVHCFTPLSFISPDKDRLRRHAAQPEVFLEIAREIASRGSPHTFATTYQNTARLRYTGILGDQLPNAGRSSHFTLSKIDPCDNDRILVLQENEALDIGCFEKKETVRAVPLRVNNQTIHTYYLVQYNH